MLENNSPLNGINKIFTALKSNVFSGNGLLNPSQPLDTITNNTIPRNSEYYDGINSHVFPNGNMRMATTYESLDFLANNIDIVKIGLAYKRLQIGTYKWQIVPVDKTDRNDYSADVKALTKFFNKPDKKRNFRLWMSKQMYNYVVYDAITIFKRKNRAGGLHSLEVIDGKTIKPLVDINGRIPDYPNPAYQQIIKGVPESSFTEQDLIYCPVNERINDLKGCSAVENIHIALNTYARSQNHNLLFFTDGVSTSAGLIAWGEELEPEPLKKVQADFNHFLSNSKNKHRTKFVPKGTEIIRMMEFKFNSDFTDHLIKIMCASLNLPQSLFIGMLNRSTSQSLDSQQEDDMLCGELMVFEDIFTDIIQNDFGKENLKFEFLKDELTDQKLLLQQVIQGVKTGIISPNEGRIKWGYKSKDGLDDPYLMTPTGAYKVENLGDANFTNMGSENNTTPTDNNVDKNIKKGDNVKKGVSDG